MPPARAVAIGVLAVAALAHARGPLRRAHVVRSQPVLLICGLRVRARAASARRMSRTAVVREKVLQLASETNNLDALADPPVPREGRVQRLDDLTLLVQLKQDLDESEFALRLSRDYASDPTSLSDLDYGKLSTKLERRRAAVCEELGERVLSATEVESLDARLEANARALGVLAQGQRPRAKEMGTLMSPLRISLSRLHVPFTLEVAPPEEEAAREGADGGASSVQPLANASALRATGRNASGWRSEPLAKFVDQINADEWLRQGRQVWARLNGKKTDELERRRESDANALTRLAREAELLAGQLSYTVSRSEAVSRVLEQQGRASLSTAPLLPAAAAVERLQAQLTATSIALHLDRVYATLEAELLAALEAPAKAAGGAGHGEGGSSSTSGVPPAKLGPIVREFESCDEALRKVEALFAQSEDAAARRVASGAGAPGPSSGEGEEGGEEAEELVHIDVDRAEAPERQTSDAARHGCDNGPGTIADVTDSPPPVAGASAVSAGAGSAPAWGPDQATQLAQAERDTLALLSRIGLPALAAADADSAAASLVRVREQAAGWLAQAKRGAAFYVRGCRLLWQDVLLACQLIARACQGYTLQKREVRAVRRTAKDMVMLVPFTILLLIPLSPLGHLLLFSFIQRTVPGFFPSAFTDQRQSMLDLYDSIVHAPQPGANQPATTL
eukprot:CAMPEP_0185192820 /NCGR_PEP_ID=MMETSP1140-20130426/20153_1 /TAXON_ID=298111 /ORGANISM="Pavlova sp., Strain CCMP459" /LENGTH=679 /DNA_ID=CAMNT_0027759583 /DNA_START=20 /DNA_END=2059 /DNA_ORIENTATION=-